jgi:hypothetical protein
VGFFILQLSPGKASGGQRMTDGNNPWQRIVEPKFAKWKKWYGERLIFEKLTIWILLVVLLLSLVMTVFLFKSKPGEIAQSLANIIGGALGVIAAVGAVLITKGLTDLEKRTEVNAIRNLLSARLLMNAASARLMLFPLRHLFSHNNSVEFSEYIASHSQIRWDEFDDQKDKLVLIDPLLPILLRNTRDALGDISRLITEIEEAKNINGQEKWLVVFNFFQDDLIRLTYIFGNNLLGLIMNGSFSVPYDYTKHFGADYDSFKRFITTGEPSKT